MTIFLICMIPVSAMLSFVLCALLSAASAADRQEEIYFAEMAKKKARSITPDERAS